MPRYFIHARMGEDKLGIFSALAYATVAMTLVCDSLGHCAIAGLSRLYAGGRRAEFRSLLLKLLAVGGALGFAGLVIAQVLGEQLLAIVYSPEYAAYSRVFVLLVFAASIYCITSMLTSGIMSARYFKIQVPMLALVAGCNAWFCAWLVNTRLLGPLGLTVSVAATPFLLQAQQTGPPAVNADQKPTVRFVPADLWQNSAS
jgi:O-antigen/teichoic acid export membrane protein